MHPTHVCGDTLMQSQTKAMCDYIAGAASRPASSKRRVGSRVGSRPGSRTGSRIGSRAASTAVSSDSSADELDIPGGRPPRDLRSDKQKIADMKVDMRCCYMNTCVLDRIQFKIYVAGDILS